MVALSPELVEYLHSPGGLKQVLVTVKERHVPRIKGELHGRKALYRAYQRSTNTNRAKLVRLLEEQQARDARVEFNPIGMFNQIALIAPPKVIEMVARHKDVEDVVPDEPELVIGKRAI